MSYVFRFHKGSETIEGWQETTQLGNKDIEAIEDPNGAKASLPITLLVSNWRRQPLAIVLRPK